MSGPDTSGATDAGEDSIQQGGEPKKRPSPTSRARRIGGAAPRPGRPAPTPAPEQPAPAIDEPTPSPAPRPAPAGPPASSSASPGGAPVPGSTPGPAQPLPPQGRSVPVQWLPSGILAVAVLTLLVLVVIFSRGVYWAKHSDPAGSRAVAQEQVLAAAKKCFVQINSYDYRHLDGLTKDDLACTTGTFTADLRKALQTQILKYAPKIHARQTAQINYTGIASVSPDGDQVVVLVYGQLNQSNDNTAKKQPRVDIVDAVVTVSRVRGTWLIAKVDSDIPST